MLGHHSMSTSFGASVSTWDLTIHPIRLSVLVGIHHCHLVSTFFRSQHPCWPLSNLLWRSTSLLAHYSVSTSFRVNVLMWNLTIHLIGLSVLILIYHPVSTSFGGQGSVHLQTSFEASVSMWDLTIHPIELRVLVDIHHSVSTSFGGQHPCWHTIRCPPPNLLRGQRIDVGSMWDLTIRPIGLSILADIHHLVSTSFGGQRLYWHTTLWWSASLLTHHLLEVSVLAGTPSDAHLLWKSAFFLSLVSLSNRYGISYLGQLEFFTIIIKIRQSQPTQNPIPCTFLIIHKKRGLNMKDNEATINLPTSTIPLVFCFDATAKVKYR